MKLHVIHTGLFKLDGGAMFGVVPKTIWQKTNPADENNMCTWAMRSLLIEDGNRLILVDTGIGNKQSEKFNNFNRNTSRLFILSIPSLWGPCVTALKEYNSPPWVVHSGI